MSSLFAVRGVDMRIADRAGLTLKPLVTQIKFIRFMTSLPERW